MKAEVVAAYGGYCKCCGESAHEFLTIDHVNGGGSQHRKQVGSQFYSWLKRQGFPKEGYRLLCMNCNFAIGKYGSCPHESERTFNS